MNNKSVEISRRVMRNFSVNFCKKKKKESDFFSVKARFFSGAKGCRAPSSGHRDTFFLARSRRVGGGGGGSF